MNNKYDYVKAMTEDIINYVNDNITLSDYDNKDDLFEALNDDKYDFAENDAHTVYTIEFTRNKAVFDKIGDANFDFDWYDIMEYDNINDAIKTFTSLYYDDSVLFVHMFMDVYYNGEVILSECKDQVMYSILDKPTLKRLENAEKSAEIYKEKYERLQKFVDMYNINDSEIDRRLQANNK